MALCVVLWKWKSSTYKINYTSDHVNIMARMLHANTAGIDKRVICVTDDPEGIDTDQCEVFPLWGDHGQLANVSGGHLPSCYRRLKLFDEQTQKDMGISRGERILSLDLDAVIVNPLHDTLVRMNGALYAGWSKRGIFHTSVFNGSLFSFVAGSELQRVWTAFDPKTSPAVCYKAGFLGSDQGWLSYQFANHAQVLRICYPEFASYPQEVRRIGRFDTKRTRIVFFHGARKPWMPAEQQSCPWIKKYWNHGEVVA